MQFQNFCSIMNLSSIIRKESVIMEDFVMKVYQFIIFLFNTIKDLVLHVSGKVEDTVTTTENNG